MTFYEARWILVPLILLTVGTWFVVPVLSIVLLVVLLFTLYFLRNPQRVIPQLPHTIVSPADGKVIVVDEVEETWFNHQRMKRVGIFLSVFDVHVNRAPCEGLIKKVAHQPGLFLDARCPEIDIKNESQNWWIEHPKGSVVVRQLAGLIARRIVAWKKEGESVSKGELIGMIRFGSRTDIYLPLECEVIVRAGDRVQGGSSIVALWSDK